MLITLLAITIGFSWAFVVAKNKLSWQFTTSQWDRPIPLVGEVIGISQRFDQGMRFDLLLSKYDLKSLARSQAVKVRLFWSQPQKLIAGDKIACLAQLKPPWHLANPGGFDQQKQFFIEGIKATGKVISIEQIIPAKHCYLNCLRQHLYQRMEDLVGKKPLLGVIQAMTLGINGNITKAQWQIFQATGTTHVVSISGSHIGLVAMLCFGLVTLIVKRFLWMTTLSTSNTMSAIVAIISAVIYSLLAGFSIPTKRSCVMILVAMLALLKRQPILTWETLAVSWFSIFIFDPLAPLQMGFWLSFGCVAALILGRSYYVGRSRFHQWLLPQWVVFIGLLPLCILFFQQIPIWSPLANLIALPIISFWVVPVSLLALLFIPFSDFCATLCLQVAHSGLSILWQILEKIAMLPHSVYEQGAPSPWVLVLAFLSAVLLLIPSGIPGRQFAWLGFLPMIFFQPSALSPGEVKFTLLDVGQGLAAVVQTQKHVLLFDAGPQYGEGEDAGKRVIKPFLLSQHIKKLDKVIISHGDLDHRAGLNGLRQWPIDAIITSEAVRLTMPSQPCVAGQSWEWDGVHFTFLNPPSTGVKKRNDLSCVLKIANEAHSILLTGDIEYSAEQKILKHFPIFLKSTILVVPHHGSLTSSSLDFVTQVAPLYALFPVGLANRYGFPKKEILKRYEAMGSQNLLVSETGALIFHLPARGSLPAPIQWRGAHKRYWHVHKPPSK
ncbi:MAG: DNA internalization-related competence protein ComEC/Rec2 [Candidatus Berkiellales bacterium]